MLDLNFYLVFLMQSQNEYCSHCKRNNWFVFCNKDGSNSVRRKEKKHFKIYQYFDSERKRGHPFYSLDKVADRTIQALGVSRSLLYSLLKKSTKFENSEENSKPMKRDSLDSFDKDLIRRVVQNLFSKHMRHISKYKLWKTLHELGFKYKDIDGGRKALVERIRHN